MAALSDHAPTVLVFLGAIIAASGALWGSFRETDHQREMRKKSEEIAELNRRTAATITGGNSFCYMKFVEQTAGSPFLLVFLQKGDYPLYDLTARIVDLDEMEKGGNRFTIEDLTRNTLRLGNFAVGSAFQLGSIRIPSGDSLRLNIFFMARNGFFDQSLRARRVGKQWVQALRVQQHDKETGKTKLLFQEVPDNFPRERDGSVKWD